jgi:hypothetical protein
VGTSGSYGGSGKADWKKVRDTSRQTFGGDGGGEGEPPPPLQERPEFFELLQNIGDALRGDDAELRRPGGPGRIPLSSVLAGGAALAGLPRLGRPPRDGAAVGRPVIAGARRAGAAVGGGIALRQGNAEALAELGLDLDEIRSLSLPEQTERIIDQVFGATSDENEQAFREAAAIILYQLLETRDATVDYQAVIREGAVEVVYRRALVEHHEQLMAGAASYDEVKDREAQLRGFISDLISAQPTLGEEDRLPTPSECSQAMADVAAIVVNALREAKPPQ